MRELHGAGNWIGAKTIESALRGLDKDRRAAKRSKMPSPKGPTLAEIEAAMQRAFSAT